MSSDKCRQINWCSQTFGICKEFLTLTIPHSVRIIGQPLLGEGRWADCGEISYWKKRKVKREKLL